MSERIARTRSLLKHRITATLDVKRLREDKNFKKEVLVELEKAGKEPRDITPLVRQYVEGLSLVHDELRSLTDADTGPWSQILVNLLEQYKTNCGYSFEAIVAFEVKQEDISEEIAISLEESDRDVSCPANQSNATQIGLVAIDKDTGRAIDRCATAHSVRP